MQLSYVFVHRIEGLLVNISQLHHVDAFSYNKHQVNALLWKGLLFPSLAATAAYGSFQARDQIQAAAATCAAAVATTGSLTHSAGPGILIVGQSPKPLHSYNLQLSCFK